jgi:hypothetical protein
MTNNNMHNVSRANLKARPSTGLLALTLGFGVQSLPIFSYAQSGCVSQGYLGKIFLNIFSARTKPSISPHGSGFKPVPSLMQEATKSPLTYFSRQTLKDLVEAVNILHHVQFPCHTERGQQKTRLPLRLAHPLIEFPYPMLVARNLGSFAISSEDRCADSIHLPGFWPRFCHWFLELKDTNMDYLPLPKDAVRPLL